MSLQDGGLAGEPWRLAGEAALVVAEGAEGPGDEEELPVVLAAVS